MPSPIISYLQRLGCIANVLLVAAIYFAVGILVALFNGDIWSLVQSLLLTAACIGVAIWLARRHQAHATARQQ